jgi:hypothetical protein
MKKLFALAAIFGLMNHLAIAQSDADRLKIDKSKVIGRMDRLAIAQLTVSYKMTTTAKAVGQDKSSGNIAGARVSAYLETTDGEMTDSDFQEITDYFYSYFQKQLKLNGIDTVAWGDIAATDFYKNGSVKEDEDKGKEEGSGGNTYVKSSAHNGNKLHGKELAFAFGKIKKASAFCEELGAVAGFFYFTLDFAEVLVNVELSSKEESLYYGTVTKKTKYTWAIDPTMHVYQSDLGFCLFWNKKDQSENIPIGPHGIAGDLKYAGNITEDVSKARTGLAKQFAFRKELTPVVIETTKEKYKAAAKKTLEKYADAFVVKSKQLKKD